MFPNGVGGFLGAGAPEPTPDEPFMGFSPVIAYDLTDESLVSTSGSSFVSADPVTQSQESGSMTVLQGAPTYVTGDGPSYARFVNTGTPAKLGVSISLPSPPANADATIIAIYKPETDTSGYVFDSEAPRSLLLPNTSNAFAAISGASVLGAVSPTLSIAANTSYGVGVTGSTVDVVKAWHAELGNTLAEYTGVEEAQSTTFPTSYSLGERFIGTSPLTDGHLYGFAIFDSILTSAQIQSIIDAFAAKFA